MIKNMRRWLADMIYPEGRGHSGVRVTTSTVTVPLRGLDDKSGMRVWACGDAGPEAVMPLSRDTSGNLVWAQGAGGPYSGGGGGGGE